MLPLSINPRTHKQYQWKGDWRKLPPLPDSLRDLWMSLIGPKVERTLQELQPSVTVDRLRSLIAKRSPDESYDEWCKIGMILHHESEGSEEGLAVWNEWSEGGDKYVSIDDLESHWKTFGDAANPATAGTLLREQVADVADFGEPMSEEELARIEEAKREAEERELSELKWMKPSEIKASPPPDWLINDVLADEELNMIYGPSGSGKSFIALDMSLAIARGIAWREFAVEQGNVGWIAAEAFGSMRNRLTAYDKLHELQATETDGLFHVLGTGVDLADGERIKLLAKSAKGLALRMIVVDTLAAAMPGTDENSGKDISFVLGNCKYLHDALGVSILLIHHMGKNEAGGARGHSSIKARVHGEYVVVKRGEATTEREMKIDKLRDGKEGLLLPFKLHELPVGFDEDGDLMKSAAVSHLPSEEPDTELRQKLDDTKDRGTRTLALGTLESLWPVDGDPVISIDSYIDAYAESLPRPPDGARDRRYERAQSKLNGLAEDGTVMINNVERTVTLLRTKARLAVPVTPLIMEEDPDADLL